MIHKNILKTIGTTPLIKLNRVIRRKKLNIFAKLEGSNPSGSIKDRIALAMIEKAELKGQLSKAKIILEASSGNTGISLAMIAAVKNYKVTIVMSNAASIERRKIIQSFGAKVVLSNQEEGTAGAINKAHKLISRNSRKYFYTNQHNNLNNFLTHYQTTAPEIWRQTKGKIDYFICSIGTCGTVMGVAKFLKEKRPKIKVIAVEPQFGEKIEGIRNLDEKNSPRNFNLYKPDLIDEIVKVDRTEALNASRQVIKEEGIFVGQSSGAAIAGIKKFAKTAKKGNIVTIFPDRGEKYLSTSLFD
ncbi:MAG: cysteine synthase [Candidatus Moranbacteria bacterium]|nr:cysteine synthase [Candidatus Moranbacteria bacterium]